ncbi:MAG TPA: phosphoribosylanthranilate isomerase [Dongiaceae bacterium]|jgi:phosphoribosylanthranilate isomerase
MPVDAKICGIKTAPALDAAVTGGARFVGFNFYARSPRSLDTEAAAVLAGRAPRGLTRVGLFVDEADETLESILRHVPLDMLQLHGQETPARIAEVRRRFGLPVMKAIKVATAEDVDGATAFEQTADWLLFDAKAPPQMAGALPGGNALSFDWTLLAGRRWNRPWMLSGGLSAANLEQAVRMTGAMVVDVSSGVEDRPGAKNPAKIAEFLKMAQRLSPSAA